MIRKSATEDPSLVQVRFSVPGEMHSSDVFLVGDFNDWDPDDTPLVTDGNGMVAATLMLDAGKKYAFRYRTKDGRWFNDECADDYEPNEFGGSNGILTT